MTEFREGEPVPSFGENSGSDGTEQNPILARAREILARQPTADEIAEDDSRRERNRIERLMAPPEPPVVFKVNENALIEAPQPAISRFQDKTPATRGYVQRQLSVVLAVVVEKMVSRAEFKRFQERGVMPEPKPRIRVKALSEHIT